MKDRMLNMIEEHIEAMGTRQRQILDAIHDLNVEANSLVVERSHLETTLYKMKEEAKRGS